MTKTKTLAWLVAGVLAVSGCARTETKGAPTTETAAEGSEAPASDAVVLPVSDQQAAGIQVMPAEVRELAETLATTGELAVNADREAHVTPRVTGRATSVLKTVGNTVRAGETLAMIESTELGQAQADFLEASARLKPAKAARDRLQRLFREDLVAQKELLAAENQLHLAEIDLDKARNRLSLLGIGTDQQAQLAAHRAIQASVPIQAPISGVIVAKHVTIGEQVAPGDEKPAFVVADLSQVWANANLYEKHLARVREGQAATVTTPAYPSRDYKGRVTLVSTQLDEDTRTAKARIVVDNSDGRLKPEMFANIHIIVGTSKKLAVPAAAIVQDQGKPYVFIRTGPETFTKRPVVLGEKTGDWIPVEHGLALGEPVVVRGGFTLKSELLKSTFGEE